MKVQQASRQEIGLLSDGTAATEGHSFHAAAAATFHQHSTPEWKVATQTWRLPHKSGSWIA